MLGLVIQLNHNIDDPCLNPAHAFNGDFVILDSHSIHSITMQYCNCHLAVSWPVQLLRSRLFPATTLNPKTAGTFRLLEAFQLLPFTSKVSAFKFYQSISRQSDNMGTCPPLVRIFRGLNLSLNPISGSLSHFHAHHSRMASHSSTETRWQRS